MSALTKKGIYHHKQGHEFLKKYQEKKAPEQKQKALEQYSLSYGYFLTAQKYEKAEKVVNLLKQKTKELEETIKVLGGNVELLKKNTTEQEKKTLTIKGNDMKDLLENLNNLPESHSTPTGTLSSPPPSHFMTSNEQLIPTYNKVVQNLNQNFNNQNQNKNQRYKTADPKVKENIKTNLNVREGITIATKAVQEDGKKNFPLALQYYQESLTLFKQAITEITDPSSKQILSNEILKYQERANQLEKEGYGKKKEEEKKQKASNFSVDVPSFDPSLFEKLPQFEPLPKKSPNNKEEKKSELIVPTIEESTPFQSIEFIEIQPKDFKKELSELQDLIDQNDKKNEKSNHNEKDMDILTKLGNLNLPSENELDDLLKELKN